MSLEPRTEAANQLNIHHNWEKHNPNQIENVGQARLSIITCRLTRAKGVITVTNRNPMKA